MHRNLAFSGLMLGMISSIIMQTVLATVLPQVALELGDAHLYGWVFSGYMLASTAAIPLFSRLADSYGRKIIYQWGMVLFITGLVLSITSQSLGQLVFYRIIQGLGASALIPAATAMISDLYPRSERGKMFGLLTAIQALANMLGPMLGGLATDLWMWQGALIINLPPCMLAFFLISFFFHEPKPRPQASLIPLLDYWGALLLGLIMLSALTLADQFVTPVVQSGYIFSLLAFTSLLIVLFRMQQKHHPDPIIPFNLLQERNIRLSLKSYFIWGVITYGAIMTLPLYGQALYGTSALEGGKMLLALTAGLGVGGGISGVLARSYGIPLLLKSGWGLMLGGFMILGMTSSLTLPYYQLVPLLVAAGAGLGIVSPVLMAAIQNNVNADRRAMMGGLFFICRNLGGALGVTLFAALITSFSEPGLLMGDPSMFTPVFVFMALASSLGLYGAFRYKA